MRYRRRCVQAGAVQRDRQRAQVRPRQRPAARSRSAAAREHGRVVVRVRDHGPGVAPDQLDAIFEPFFRGGDELTRRQKGTGIGLALVRDLVELMHGDVRGENRAPGFEVRIALAADARTPRIPRTVRSGAAQPDAQPRLAGELDAGAPTPTSRRRSGPRRAETRCRDRRSRRRRARAPRAPSRSCRGASRPCRRHHLQARGARGAAERERSQQAARA